MKIALAQLNPTVGDLNGNLEKLKLNFAEIGLAGADLMILPELFLCGYPPRDLLDHSSFVNQCESALEELKKLSTLYPKTAILVGTITRCQLTHGKKLHNSAVLIENGKTLFTQSKSRSTLFAMKFLEFRSVRTLGTKPTAPNPIFMNKIL
jgi:predicted amidohydrolase